MVAAHTVLPVIGVPVQSAALNGLDSLLSIVQMPRGVPVATVAIGPSGAANAGLLAVAILATSRPELRARLQAYRDRSPPRCALRAVKFRFQSSDSISDSFRLVNHNQAAERDEMNLKSNLKS